jgi:asparagine synthetase B (glutamine-hydrolysing)
VEKKIMCGLVGSIDLRNERRVDKEVLVKMAGAITHRGSDASGYFTDGNVGLAFGGCVSSISKAAISRCATKTARSSWSAMARFTITANRAMDESRYQRAMARRIGSTHHELVFDWAEIAERLGKDNLSL